MIPEAEQEPLLAAVPGGCFQGSRVPSYGSRAPANQTRTTGKGDDRRARDPRGLLEDGGYLTELRTGAAGALAVRLLAPGRIERMALIGTGVQARFGEKPGREGDELIVCDLTGVGAQDAALAEAVWAALG